jgi:hypothetical protein
LIIETDSLMLSDAHRALWGSTRDVAK